MVAVRSGPAATKGVNAITREGGDKSVEGGRVPNAHFPNDEDARGAVYDTGAHLLPPGKNYATASSAVMASPVQNAAGSPDQTVKAAIKHLLSRPMGSSMALPTPTINKEEPTARASTEAPAKPASRPASTFRVTACG